MRTRLRGFTLVELGVVVAGFAVLATLALSYLAGDRDREQRAAMVRQQAQEMAQLARAAYEHGAANLATLTTPAMSQVTVAALVSANRLPAGFANRFGAVGTTPLGLAYHVRVGKSATNVVEVIITESGARTSVRESAMRRAGLSNTDVDLRAFQEGVARAVGIDYKMIGGVFNASSNVLQGNFQGFTFDATTPFLSTAGSPPTYPRAAVVRGIVSIDPTPPGTTPGGPQGQFASCQIAYAGRNPSTLAYYHGTCPSGYTSVATWRHCGYALNNTDGIISTPAGTITLGRYVSNRPSSESGACDAGAFPQCRNVTNDTVSQSVAINNSLQQNYTCSEHTWDTNTCTTTWNCPIRRGWVFDSSFNDALCCR